VAVCPVSTPTSVELRRPIENLAAGALVIVVGKSKISLDSASDGVQDSPVLPWGLIHEVPKELRRLRGQVVHGIICFVIHVETRLHGKHGHLRVDPTTVDSSTLMMRGH
jgi:hypothetical protein